MVTTVTNNSVQQINTSLFSLEKDTDGKVLLLNQKIKEANDAIASINKILDGLNKDANVVSVNGKTGIVTLDASDVGALPSSTHIPSDPVQSDWTETNTGNLAYIKNKPSLATVATSGSYNDLSNKPSIPDAQVNSDWNATSGVAEILHKPTIPTVVDTVADGNINAVTSNAVYHYRPPKLAVKAFFHNNVSGVAYFKISSLMQPYKEGVFLLQSRAGELLVISVGHGDGTNLAAPKIVRLIDTYSKILGFTYNSSGDVFVAVNAYSHECYLTQLAGSDYSILVTSSTQSDYESGTAITIETP